MKIYWTTVTLKAAGYQPRTVTGHFRAKTNEIASVDAGAFARKSCREGEEILSFQVGLFDPKPLTETSEILSAHAYPFYTYTS